MSELEAAVVHLRVVTPERVILDEPVEWVQVPLEDGMLGVWPEHAPLIARMMPGELTLSQNGVPSTLTVGAGILLVDETHCVVLYTDSNQEVAGSNLDGLVDEMETALGQSLGEVEMERLQEHRP
ncbi:MAG: F0F1 ATP synthase subunit epsilon [Anaerolineae bacterium]|nr:F0F1 ATP synthase subunit epsilon [Chloroflexota bacterium]